MSYQINRDDTNKLVFDGEYAHYSIPVPPIPRVCTTYTLLRYFWKTCELAHYVKHVLPDHVHRPMDITVIPKKFNPNEIEEGKFLGIITKYRPKNFVHDLKVLHSKRDIIFDEYINAIKNQED